MKHCPNPNKKRTLGMKKGLIYEVLLKSLYLCPIDVEVKFRKQWLNNLHLILHNTKTD